LKSVPKVEGNPYIILGRKRGTHLVGFHKLWDDIRVRAKIQDCRAHDLRRTLGSMLAQSGNSLQLIGKVLNHAHSNTSTTTIYAHLAEDQTRIALQSHGEKLEKILNSF
jgi:integrase